MPDVEIDSSGPHRRTPPGWLSRVTSTGMFGSGCTRSALRRLKRPSRRGRSRDSTSCRRANQKPYLRELGSSVRDCTWTVATTGCSRGSPEKRRRTSSLSAMGGALSNPTVVPTELMASRAPTIGSASAGRSSTRTTSSWPGSIVYWLRGLIESLVVWGFGSVPSVRLSHRFAGVPGRSRRAAERVARPRPSRFRDGEPPGSGRRRAVHSSDDGRRMQDCPRGGPRGPESASDRADRRVARPAGRARGHRLQRARRRAERAPDLARQHAPRPALLLRARAPARAGALDRAEPRPARARGGPDARRVRQLVVDARLAPVADDRSTRARARRRRHVPELRGAHAVAGRGAEGERLPDGRGSSRGRCSSP